MKKAAIYVKHKMNSFTSPESKIERCKDFAKSNKLDVIDIYCDRVKDNSQRKLDLEQLLTDSKQHKFDCVVILSISNLSRKIDEFVKIYKTLKKNNVELLSSMYEDEDIQKLENMGLLQWRQQ